jgi:hypothetical protein
MTDIVERLRDHRQCTPITLDAADEIERLREQLSTVRELREYDRTKVVRVATK